MKESYFPNWHVTGAKGPYRLAPNLMVVVPTSKHVELTYGLTAADWAGRVITVAGAVGLVLLGLWTGARRFAADRRRPDATADDDRRRRSGDDAPGRRRATTGGRSAGRRRRTARDPVHPTVSRPTGENRPRRYHDPALRPEPLSGSW